jgi:GNAT superfamily N-acetyltransferase
LNFKVPLCGVVLCVTPWAAWVAVREDRQRTGIGTKLAQTVEKLFKWVV